MDEPPTENRPDEEEVDEDDEPLKAGHPRLERIQRALFEQLTRQHERVLLQDREKTEELRKLVKHREDLGVTLYSQQRELAKLQKSLEGEHDRHASHSATRARVEERLKEVQVEYERSKAEVDQALQRLNRAQDELNKVNITVKQVEDYNEALQSEIKVARRATYRAEDAIKAVEKKKIKQDVLIDRMETHLRKLKEDRAVVEAQIAAQQKETAIAVETLKEAAREIDAMRFEKKQLVSQWRATLLGTQKRDEAVARIQQQTGEQVEEELRIINSIQGLKKAVAREQEKHEKLVEIKDANESEMQMLQSQMTAVKAERERLMEEYNLLKRSLDHTAADTAKLDIAITEADHKVSILNKEVQKVSRKTVALYTDIEEKMNEQLTTTRSQASSKKDAAKVAKRLAEKISETEQLQNEVSRIKVDTLNAEAHNRILRDRNSELSAQLKEKDRVVSQFETEVKKRHLDIEKKQLNVDRLNRTYAEKRAKLEAESGEVDVQSPMELAIKQLRRSIAETAEKNTFLQKEWMQAQTTLMQRAAERDELQTHIQQQRNKQIVLEQRRKRLEGQLASEEKEIKTLQRDIRHLRLAMDRMSSDMTTRTQRKEIVESENSAKERSFVAKLREIEAHCSEIEKAVDEVKQERDAMVDEAVEAERQTMLWERKLHMEKEVSESLDPSVGQADKAAMEREIHRMELRLAQLKRRQEALISEMERTIHKRDVIDLKYEPKSSATGAKSGARRLANLKASLKQSWEAAEAAEREAQEKERSVGALRERVDNLTEEATSLEMNLSENALAVEAALVQEAAARSDRQRLENMAQRFAEAIDAGERVMPSHEARRESAEQQVKREKVLAVVRSLREAYPSYDQVFGPLFQWLGAEPE